MNCRLKIYERYLLNNIRNINTKCESLVYTYNIKITKCSKFIRIETNFNNYLGNFKYSHLLVDFYLLFLVAYKIVMWTLFHRSSSFDSFSFFSYARIDYTYFFCFVSKIVVVTIYNISYSNTMLVNFKYIFINLLQYLS